MTPSSTPHRAAVRISSIPAVSRKIFIVGPISCLVRSTCVGSRLGPGPIGGDAIRRCLQDLKDRPNRHECPVNAGGEAPPALRSRPGGDRRGAERRAQWATSDGNEGSSYGRLERLLCSDHGLCVADACASLGWQVAAGSLERHNQRRLHQGRVPLVRHGPHRRSSVRASLASSVSAKTRIGVLVPFEVLTAAVCSQASAVTRRSLVPVAARRISAR